MKKVVLTGIEKMKLISVAEPLLINADEVKIKLSSIGVCGSDVHYYKEGKIGSQIVSFPFAVGHECSGVVVEAGKDVAHLKMGDMVVIDPAIYCGQCDQCMSGRFHTCRNNKFLGCPGQMEGCLSEYIIMPAFTCYPVTGKLNSVQAALIEPFSIGVYAVKKSSIHEKHSSVLIFGAGPIGLSILLMLNAQGNTDTGVIEPLDYRLSKAKEMGARYLINPQKEDVEARVKEIHPLLADVVFEASGEQDAVNNAIKILKPGGKLILVGIPPQAQFIFDMDLMRRKELTVINIRRQNHCVQEAISLVMEGKADLEKMVTHHFMLQDSDKAFEMVSGYKDGVVKAIISC